MADRIEFGKHLKPLAHEAAIRATYLGQAHIAGTGPAGMTCRECAFWGVMCKKDDGEKVIISPGHYAASNKARGGAASQGRLLPLSEPEIKPQIPRRCTGLPSIREERKPAACRSADGGR